MLESLQDIDSSLPVRTDHGIAWIFLSFQAKISIIVQSLGLHEIFINCWISVVTNRVSGFQEFRKITEFAKILGLPKKCKNAMIVLICGGLPDIFSSWWGYQWPPTLISALQKISLSQWYLAGISWIEAKPHDWGCWADQPARSRVSLRSTSFTRSLVSLLNGLPRWVVHPLLTTFGLLLPKRSLRTSLRSVLRSLGVRPFVCFQRKPSP